ncbi:MAG TPA: 4Fe-4S binding protein [Gammaproteobacteria bacterium]|nr:4Fe-4S binding protein [Gammaproteobacteria bacterium]
MLMPGLPAEWVWLVWAGFLALSLWALFVPVPERTSGPGLDSTRLPLVGPWIAALTRTPWLLVSLRLLMAGLFLLIIAAGLFGTPMPKQNAATLLTWNLWWSGVIVSVFLLGSVWCAVCPWDALASWLVRRRLWGRGRSSGSLELTVPRWLRGVWVATVAFLFLSWLELGFGLTADPYATALLALLMVLAATLSMAVFSRKAFCRGFCPVGRTIGAYSQLAPVALRPRDPAICADCTTLECYHGSERVEPCPTSLVMGRLRQNTYCTSCGNCSQSCPHDNVGWRLRSPSQEAMLDARPHWDEAWFMLTLLSITLFHGLTMLDPWEKTVRTLAAWLGDSGQLILSFSLAMAVACLVPPAVYAAVTRLAHRLSGQAIRYRDLFSGLAFVALPLAFGYHLAHNLMHLDTETHGLGQVLANPLGKGVQPLSMQVLMEWMNDSLFPPAVLHLAQSALILFGYWLAMLVLRHRARHLLGNVRRHGWPLLLFALLVGGGELWMLSQPMLMRFQ